MAFSGMFVCDGCGNTGPWRAYSDREIFCPECVEVIEILQELRDEDTGRGLF